MFEMLPLNATYINCRYWIVSGHFFHHNTTGRIFIQWLITLIVVRDGLEYASSAHDPNTTICTVTVYIVTFLVHVSTSISL